MKQKHTSPSHRTLRVGEEIRHIIAGTLMHGGFDDPALMNSSLITVTEVRVSPDLKNATAYVMPLGGVDAADILPALNDNAAHFQRDIARQMKTRFTPRVIFKFDDSFGEAERIERILYDLKKNAPDQE